MAKLKNDTTVITNPVRLSYAHVWEPVSIEGSEPKYGASILIPKDDKETASLIEEAIEAAKELGREKRFGGKIPKNLKLPLRDGDDERPDDPAYEGMWFVNANSKTAPAIVDLARNPVTDETEVYSGCWCRTALTFYAFDVSGNRGIACGLGPLQKVRDDAALAGGISASEAFEDDYVGDDDDFME
jgi:hypothetical protein